jgi:hypothetical protein
MFSYVGDSRDSGDFEHASKREISQPEIITDIAKVSAEKCYIMKKVNLP